MTDHLGHLFDRRGAGGRKLSSPFRGGQRAADGALGRFDVTGYAAAAQVVYPQRDRSGSALSPWVRNGMLSLDRLWYHVEGGPADDVAAFRRSLSAQDQARRAYAVDAISGGPAVGPRATATDPASAWDRRMGCIDLPLGELDDDGWTSLGARQWLAHHWLTGADDGSQPDGLAARMAAGEDEMFRRLIDGSRAVNRWSWRQTLARVDDSTVLSRWQVERRAPGLCASCPLVAACPIDHEVPGLVDLAVATDLRPPASTTGQPGLDQPGAPVGAQPGTQPAFGPMATVLVPGTGPEAVWLTAESMGDADPALAAHPDLPAVFVFDEPLLARLRLTPKRLVFLTETLSDLATCRPVEIWLGSPATVLTDRPLAVTFTPVPGWHRLSARLDVVAVHPWPWLGQHGQSPLQTAAGSGKGRIRGESDSSSRPIDGVTGRPAESSTGRNIGALV